MIICPNLSNSDVAREFNELKNATSEAAAYHIWSLNNGNAIDRAPNGAPSKLFLTLLEHYNGDRVKAIQAKAKTYGTSFLNWFGDWTSQTLKKYRYLIYNVPKDRYLSADELSEVRNKFNSGQDIVVYAASNDVQSLLNGIDFRKNQSLYVNIDTNAFYASYTLGYAMDYANQYANQKGQDLNKIGIVKIVINNNNGHISLQGESEVKIYSGATIKSIEQLDIDKNVRHVEIKSRKSNSVSKVVDENGEPKVMYHASKNKFTAFDKGKINTGLGLLEDEANGFYFSTDPEVVKTKTYNVVYPVFLNARNIFDDNNYASDEFTKHSLNIIATATSRSSKTADALLNRDRLSVGNNIYDELVVFEPNQIKLATDNNGMLSTPLTKSIDTGENNNSSSIRTYEVPSIEIKQVDTSTDLMSLENENNTEENRSIIEKIVRAAVLAVNKFKRKEIRAKAALKKANKQYGTTFLIEFDKEYNPSIPPKLTSDKKENRNESKVKIVEELDKFSQYRLSGKESFSELVRMQNDDIELYLEYIDAMGQDIMNKCNQ